MKKVLVTTIGKGRDVGHGIAYSIRHNSPKLVVFLATSDSWEKTSEEILNNIPGLFKVEDLKNYKEWIEKHNKNSNDLPYLLFFNPYDELNDVDVLTRFYTKILLDVARFFPPQDIVVDYTSGTKSMSVALVFAALDVGAGEISYISGQRDENGRVISNTESVYSISTKSIFSRRNILKAIDYYNNLMLISAVKAINETEINIRHPLYKDIEFLKLIFEGFSNWDVFNHPKAAELFGRVLGNFSDVAAQWRLKRKLETINSVLYNFKEKRESPDFIFDLIANAKRRLRLGRYDDATARLYRAVEFIGQLKLKEHGIDPSNVDISKIRNESVKWELQNLRKPDGTLPVGLDKVYWILAEEFDEPIGKFFIQNKGEIRKFLHIRNHSILAHGFEPINKKAVQGFLEFVEKTLLPEIFREDSIKRKQEVFEFPEIDLNNALKRIQNI